MKFSKVVDCHKMLVKKIQSMINKNNEDSILDLERSHSGINDYLKRIKELNF